jgi:hypothetical protein
MAVRPYFDLPFVCLCVDLGQAHWVAVCDEGLRPPLTASGATLPARRTAEIAALVQREARGTLWFADGGRNAEDTDEGAQARLVRYATTCWRPRRSVAFWDETLISVDAAELLRQGGGRVELMQHVILPII